MCQSRSLWKAILIVQIFHLTSNRLAILFRKNLARLCSQPLHRLQPLLFSSLILCFEAFMLLPRKARDDCARPLTCLLAYGAYLLLDSLVSQSDWHPHSTQKHMLPFYVGSIAHRLFPEKARIDSARP